MWEITLNWALKYLHKIGLKRRKDQRLLQSQLLTEEESDAESVTSDEPIPTLVEEPLETSTAWPNEVTLLSIVCNDAPETALTETENSLSEASFGETQATPEAEDDHSLGHFRLSPSTPVWREGQFRPGDIFDRAQCAKCGVEVQGSKANFRSARLFVHARSCLGIRAFSCGKCQKTFSRSGECRSHIRRVCFGANLKKMDKQRLKSATEAAVTQCFPS